MKRPFLQQPYFRPFPLGSVKPLGWLNNQLRIQADGLSGHLDEFWPDIKDSAWFGGTAEGWERAPYWLDGVIPLAYLLDDPVLSERLGQNARDRVAAYSWEARAKKIIQLFEELDDCA